MAKFKLSPSLEGKETFTLDEINSIIADVTGFVGSQFKEFVSPEEVSKIKDELKPYKQKERKDKINSLVGELTDADKLEAAIALANLNEEDDDATITTKVKGVIEKSAFLQKTQTKDPAVIKNGTQKTTEITLSKEEEQAQSRVKNL